MMEGKRFAVVTGARSEREVAAYLPGNYAVVAVRTLGEGTRPEVIISGEDRFGWTLEEYVVPRLASGLIACRELDESEGVV
jgi:streptogramin lyase